MDDTGLFLEVWDHAEGEEVVIVFCGTDEAKDWWSNGRFLTRLLPLGWDQYPVVRTLIDGLVRRSLQRMPHAKIVTTGHSLGGGLAQHAAYAHPGIQHVIAFDSSPLTGFRDLPKEVRIRNSRDVEIARVYEKGEILAYVRGFLRRYLPLSMKDPSITEARFDLTRGLTAKQHPMTALAGELAKLSA